MFFKIIFVLATVYVVNASVITINVFDDDPDTEIATNPRACDNRACDQLCRRLKFSGGACVNGRCKCDNFLNTEDDLEAEVATYSGSCNVRACDQLCRRLKFPGGTCVNGRCKCDNFLNTEGGVSEKYLFILGNAVLEKDDPDTEVVTNPRACDNRACDQLCRRLKFSGGACVNGRCKCDNFLNTEDDLEAKVATSSGSCNVRACDQLCRRLKFPGGTCVNGRCKCDNFLNTEDGVSEKSLFTLENSVSQKDNPEAEVAASCNLRACEQQCHRLGFRGGACVNGRCKCDNFLNTKVSEDTLSNLEDSASPRSCDNKKCNELCRKLKFREGTCIAGRCRCNNFYPLPKDVVSENSIPVSESSKNQTERNCNLRSCNLLCRRLKFPSGTCVDGRCKCSNIWRTDDPLLSDATIEEKEESNLVLRTNEEELTIPSPSACNTVNCNEMCHRLKYIGGMCRGGVCQCY